MVVVAVAAVAAVAVAASVVAAAIVGLFWLFCWLLLLDAGCLLVVTIASVMLLLLL